MKWWENLSNNEKIMVGVGGIIISIILFYLFIWSPFTAAVSSSQVEYQHNQQLLAWMQKNISQLQALQLGQSKTLKKVNSSLLALLENSVKNSPTANAKPTLTQANKNEVKIDFNEVSFSNFILWLQKLTSEYAVQVTKVTLAATQKPGIVKVNLILRS